MSLASSPWRRFRKLTGKTGDDERFWALRDVSFDVSAGEVVGIIGHNGAGKSTLLKILSRITIPTTGMAKLTGRIASLLEIGTGFHPELTGRENIFLNGAILGMSRAEIKRNFDAIVDFASVETFLDTPVKRYSSGMFVRLAFAVAAHLESEILVVDEVLAVGDAAFQKKCMDKMKEVGQTGQTILFVSHNMATIRTVCKRSIVLDKGRMIANAPTDEAVRLYLSETCQHDGFERPKQKDGTATLVQGRLVSEATDHDARLHVSLKIACTQRCRVALDVRLKDNMGSPVGFGSFGTLSPPEMIELGGETTDLSFDLVTKDLATGDYSISFDLTAPGRAHFDRVENAMSFELRRQPQEGRVHPVQQPWGYGSWELSLAHLQVESCSDTSRTAA